MMTQDKITIETYDDIGRQNTAASGCNASVATDSAPLKVHGQTLMVVLAMCVIQFALLIQLVAVGVYPADIAAVVGGASLSSWMFTGLTITFVVLAPPVSQISDYWGRRWPLIILCLIGFAGTMICARCTSMTMAIAGEVLVGVSFASTPLTLAVVSEVLPHRLRLAGQAAIGIANNLGALFALLAGAALIRHKGPEAFRIIFYINAALFVLSAALTFFFYSPLRRDLEIRLDTLEKLGRLDWAGYALVACGAVLFVTGLSWAENPYPWNKAHVLAPFILGCVFFILLGLYSWKVKKNGLIHHGLFSRDRNCALGFVGIFCEGMVFGIANVFSPLQQSIVYGSNTWTISLVYTTAVLVSCAIAPLAAYISYRYKEIRFLATGGFISFVILSITIATTTASGKAAFWGFQVFLGSGLSLCLYAVVSAAQLSAPPELISVTSGLLSSIRSLGVTLAVAIGVAIFHSKSTEELPKQILEAATSHGLPPSEAEALLLKLLAGEFQDLTGIPGVTRPIIQASVVAMKHAYLASFHAVWYMICPFAALGAIACFFIVNPTKDLNNTIDAPIQTAESGK